MALLDLSMLFIAELGPILPRQRAEEQQLRHSYNEARFGNAEAEGKERMLKVITARVWKRLEQTKELVCCFAMSLSQLIRTIHQRDGRACQ